MPILSKNQKLLLSHRKVEFFVLRQRLGFEGFCPKCRCERQFVAVEEAMALTGDSMLSVFGSVSAGVLHHIESDAGVLMICESSIPPLSRTAA